MANILEDTQRIKHTRLIPKKQQEERGYVYVHTTPRSEHKLYWSECYTNNRFDTYTYTC